MGLSAWHLMAEPLGLTCDSGKRADSFLKCGAVVKQLGVGGALNRCKWTNYMYITMWVGIK